MSEYYTGTLSGKKLVGTLRSSAALGAKVYPRGNDGISPVISVEDIPGGHRVTMTDAEGVKTFPVLDGRDGASGADPIVMEETGTVISVSDAAERAFPGLTIYGRTTQDSTPAPEAPVAVESAGASGAINTTVTGRNLLNPSTIRAGSNTTVSDGVATQINADSSTTLTFKCQGYRGTTLVFSKAVNFTTTGTVAISFEKEIGVTEIKFGLNGKTKDSVVFANIADLPIGIYSLSVNFTNITQGSVSWKDMMINHGSAAEYEPYKEKQEMTVSTPNGLKGIPVASGGNHTDAEGQQWICDEVDFERGVYVQRINTLIFDGTESWGTFADYPHLFTHDTTQDAQRNRTSVFCSHFPYDPGGLMEGKDGCRFAVGSVVQKIYKLYISSSIHTSVDTFKAWLAERSAAGDPVTVYYVLYTPIETPLSGEQLAAFAQLRSCKPNTTVLNDAGAYMDVQYAADTKIYVDDRYEELAEEIMNGGGSADLTGYATEQWVQEGFQPKGNYLTKVPDGYAREEDIPTKPEDIGAQPAGNYATKEEIPSVPVQSVNGKTGTVTLTAADVKARSENWMPTAQDVGADPRGTAAAAVSEHNTGTGSHNDLRIELKALSDRLTAFFDSDDTTLDELSEIVAYITNNKTLIDSITTAKVSVSDIVNNLTTNVTNKPLSAAQGVVLNGLINTLSNSLANCQPKGDYALRSDLPTKVSQLQNDAGYLTLGTLPVYNGEVQ